MITTGSIGVDESGFIFYSDIFHVSFQLPFWVIERINKIRRDFLVHGANQNGKKVHLPKELRLLGVIDLKMN
jgi:hypothetical protein